MQSEWRRDQRSLQMAQVTKGGSVRPDSHQGMPLFAVQFVDLCHVSPQWNFEKFLVDKNGNVVQRWGSITSPTTIDALIAKII